MNNEKIWILITRVLSGEATPAEEAELQDWLKEKPENETLFNDLKASWNQEPGDISYLFDQQRGLQKLQGKMKQAEGVAVSHNSPRTSKRFTPLLIASAIILLTGMLSVFVTVQLWEEPAPEMVTHATTAVEQRIISLPDGSGVRLNKNSQISYPENFEGDERRLELTGEAYFDVAENPKKPFIITTGDAVVEVLGTSFSVKEHRQDSKIMVIVKNGMVSFRHHEKETGVKLRKGSLGMLEWESRKIKIEQVNPQNYYSWINGHLSFDNQPLKEVATQLERIYDIEIYLEDSSLTDLRLTAYTTDLVLEEVLEMISQSLKISHQQDGDVIRWMNKNDNS